MIFESPYYFPCKLTQGKNHPSADLAAGPEFPSNSGIPTQFQSFRLVPEFPPSSGVPAWFRSSSPGQEFLPRLKTLSNTQLWNFHLLPECLPRDAEHCSEVNELVASMVAFCVFGLLSIGFTSSKP